MSLHSYSESHGPSITYGEDPNVRPVVNDEELQSYFHCQELLILSVTSEMRKD